MIDIDEEGKLILTNKTKIPDDILDKVKKIIIDESFDGIWYDNIFENNLRCTRDLINLEEVDFSNYTFNRMYNYSFWNCKKIKSIELPETIKILNFRCFSGCELLESVILHGVKTIYGGAFYECFSLEYLFISDEIKEINVNAFLGIPKEQEITIICPEDRKRVV